MKQIQLLALLLLFCSPVFGQKKYSKEILKTIEYIENNITGNTVVNDAKPNTIAAQMAKYKVNGMSIAVIRN